MVASLAVSTGPIQREPRRKRLALVRDYMDNMSKGLQLASTAHVTMPYHRLLDQAMEMQRGDRQPPLPARLGPGAGGRLEIGMRRFQHRPSYGAPWDDR